MSANSDGRNVGVGASSSGGGASESGREREGKVERQKASLVPLLIDAINMFKWGEPRNGHLRRTTSNQPSSLFLVQQLIKMQRRENCLIN